MRLDVIIPTYNRQAMVQRTLASLLAAHVPEGMTVRVAVVDNNSKDETRRVVAEWAERFAGRLTYVYETRQGRSPAINAGVAATSGELVGMIDDDEEVAPDWFEQIRAAFPSSDVDYIGGKCLPRWEAEPPAWLPEDYRGVIGWVDGGDEPRAYGRDYPGILTGGNAVIRRATLERIGGYSNSLGRTDKGLLSCEDEEMYQRLLESGARGLYVP
ncbi:MAG TPA: glycosyltransferase family 2 protein, partial [Pyrinomonadaceae bacterium]|nr:glycosyltransferase family 2 protein [Pyrinomonadaceae bacterium]